MGGGNGLKSFMSREKNKGADKPKSSGGGSSGIKDRCESKIGLSCAICKVSFVSNKMKAQLKDHWEAKHSKVPYSACFPGETVE